MSATDSEKFPLKLKRFVAVGFGSGLIKPAPGTWGSIAALLIAFLLNLSSLQQEYYVLSLFCLLFCLLNFWSAEAAIQKWGKDPSQMVMDEFAGLFLALALIFEITPFAIEDKLSWWNNYYTFLVIFVGFRFFDIIKPLGINRLQQYSGGFGILLDDLAAGGLTVLLIYTIYLLI
jgi:phosphatidylglycerophosphatase A